MKKKIYIYIVFFISLFIIANNVKADNDIAYWLECSYKAYDDLGTDRPLVFIGARNTNSVTVGDYRLINTKVFQEHSSAYNPWGEYENPNFDGCWFKSADDINEKCTDKKFDKYSGKEALARLRAGICPAAIRMSNDGKRNIVFAGEGNLKEVYYLKGQYRLYKDDGAIHSYGFNENGYFVHTKNGEVISEFNTSGGDISGNTYISSNVTIGIDRFGKNFMNVGENDYSSVILSKNAELIFDSNDNKDKLYDAINTWLEVEGISLVYKSTNIKEIKENNTNLINSCSILNQYFENGEKYDFEKEYSPSMMLKDLDIIFSQLQKVHSTEKFEMCNSKAGETTENYLFSAYNCSMKNLLGDVNYVSKDLQNFVLRDINNYLNNTKNFQLDSEEEILKILLKCSAFLDKNNAIYELDSNETSRIRQNYENLSKNKGISFVFDCESLIGQDLLNKINSYLDIIKIAIPIILIAFGIFDFTKATFAGKEDDMKKAQQDFIKRLGIAILIFFVPTIVNLILTIANEVWKFISPDTCGLF